MNDQLFINIKKIIPVGFVIIFLFVSCRLDLPVKEMALAKLNITRAVDVKADKYAPEALKEAKDELIKCHDNIKVEDVKAAKKAAEESLKYSNDAIAKSLPLLANDSLKEARNIYEEANTAFAEKYAPEDFASAGAKIGEAESMLADKEYWESYLKSSEARNNAASARDKALSNIAALQESIKRIGMEAKDIESLGGREFAPEEMRTIDINLEDASSLLEKENVKEASVKIADAESALKQADIKTRKEIAAAKIKAAEEALQKLEASPLKDAFLDDLGKAGGLINESKELFDKEAYNESGVKSEEALSVLDSIAIAIEKKAEEKTIAEGVEPGSGETGGSETGGLTEYVVKYNPENRDCLWRISLYSYRDARLWPLIYIANKDQIKDPDLIFPGQKFIIPAIPKAYELKESKGESDTETKEKLPDIDKSKENQAIEELKENAPEDAVIEPDEKNK